jgi:hypothetical protein
MSTGSMRWSLITTFDVGSFGIGVAPLRVLDRTSNLIEANFRRRGAVGWKASMDHKAKYLGNRTKKANRRSSLPHLRQRDRIQIPQSSPYSKG